MAAQNVFDKPNGAFTGEISASQLKDSGIGWTLTGHSERRVIMSEDDSVSERHGNWMGGKRDPIPHLGGGGIEMERNGSRNGREHRLELKLTRRTRLR